MKESFKDFLIDYVSDGQKLPEDAMNELEFLANEFVFTSLEPQFYFSSNATDYFLYYIKEYMCESNQSFFNLTFDENRYSQYVNK